MTGNVVLLAAFLMEAHPTAAPLDKIVANLHLNDGADPGEGIDDHRDQRAVAQAEEIRLIGRLCIIGRFLGNGDALKQRMGFLRGQDRRLAFLDRVVRTPDGMGLLGEKGSRPGSTAQGLGGDFPREPTRDQYRHHWLRERFPEPEAHL
jgi:hypothetical protein